MSYQSVLYLHGYATEAEPPKAAISMFSDPDTRNKSEKEIVLGLGKNHQSLKRLIFTAGLSPLAVWEKHDDKWMSLPKERYDIMFCVDLWRKA